MNSSIFNSKACWLSIGVLLIGLLGTEVFFRTVVLNRSSTARTINQFMNSDFETPQQAVSIFGNSYSINGIDTNSVTNALQQTDLETRITTLHGSHICEWYWLSKLKYFEDPNPPKYVVLNIGKGTLLDRSQVRHRRLAMIFGASGQPLLPEFGVQSKSTLEFILARFSMALNRGRNVGTDLSLKSIAEYRSEKKHLANRENAMREPVEAPTADPPATTREIFDLYLNHCNNSGIKLIIVLMPQKTDYQLNPELESLLQEKTSIIDHREIEDIQPDHFLDQVHMNKTGKQIYTPIYQQDLVSMIQKIEGDR